MSESREQVVWELAKELRIKLGLFPDDEPVLARALAACALETLKPLAQLATTWRGRVADQHCSCSECAGIVKCAVDLERALERAAGEKS